MNLTNLLFVSLLGSPAAMAQEAGIPVTVQVLSEDGLPIRNAWVRLPDTEGRRLVERESGEWTASMLYDAIDGSEIMFQVGTLLDMTVSAPGYSSRRFQYTVAKRRNYVVVELSALTVPDYSTESPDNINWFQRTSQRDIAEGPDEEKKDD